MCNNEKRDIAQRFIAKLQEENNEREVEVSIRPNNFFTEVIRRNNDTIQLLEQFVFSGEESECDCKYCHNKRASKIFDTNNRLAVTRLEEAVEGLKADRKEWFRESESLKKSVNTLAITVTKLLEQLDNIENNYSIVNAINEEEN